MRWDRAKRSPRFGGAVPCAFNWGEPAENGQNHRNNLLYQK